MEGLVSIHMSQVENKQSLITLEFNNKPVQGGYMFKFFKSVLIFGQIIFVLPLNILKYMCVSTEENIYMIKSRKWQNTLFILLQLLGIGFLIRRYFILPTTNIINIPIFTQITTLYSLAYICYILATYLTILLNKSKFTVIFNRADNLERLLIENEIPYKFSLVKILSCTICILFAASGTVKYIFTPYSSFEEFLNGYAKELIDLLTFSKEHFDISTLKPSIKYTIGSCSLALDLLTYFAWNFADVIRIIFAMTMWWIYYRVNKTLQYNLSGSKSVAQAIEIHLAASYFMEIINELLAPITLFGTILLIFSSLHITNYVIAGCSGSPTLIFFYVLILRNIVITLACVFVSIQVQELSNWVITQITCTNLETISEIDKRKIIILCMNRKNTGFKGFGFYISSRYVLVILSIVTVYSLLISQFVKTEGINYC